MKNVFRNVLCTLLVVSAVTVANFASADPTDGGAGGGGDCSDPTVICNDPGTGGDGGAGGGNALCGQDQLQMVGDIFDRSYCVTSMTGPAPICLGKVTTRQHYICLRRNGTFYPALPGGIAIITTPNVYVECDYPACK